MKINKHTSIWCAIQDSKPVTYALEGLKRDWARIFGQAPIFAEGPAPNQIQIQYVRDGREEAFSIRCNDTDASVQIGGSDDLGVVFGIYHFCDKCLGVDPYEFWTDFEFVRRDEVTFPSFEYVSPEPKVRFRGWFVNDEDCLIGWHDEMKVSLDTWKQVFETLLRAGYNMIIPGTSTASSDPQVQLAADMGLWITQHHAEPLGAQMFAEAYPGVQPRVPEEIERFKALYTEAIRANQGRKIIWVLGFRGQGDLPFFGNDPRYDTPVKAGALISEMIQLQKQLVQELNEGPHYFAHYIYAESAELYRDGHLALDDDVIRIWSDDGFGVMRMRRPGAEDESLGKNVPALPLPKDKGMPNGVYYHLSFHDVQISSKLVPLVDPALIREQFQLLFDSGEIKSLVLNVSNVRPHVFNIELVDKLMRFPEQAAGPSGDVVKEHYRAWTQRHFGGHAAEVQDLIERYHKAPFQYGSHPGDRAGEQVYHHILRRSIEGAMKGISVVQWFSFIADRPPDNDGCYRWVLKRAEASLPGWCSLHQDTEAVYSKLEGRQARYFSDSIRTHVNYMYYSCQGCVYGLKGVLAYEQKDYKSAFCLFCQGKKAMESAWETLTASEHDKWTNFYRGEWLTNTRETVRYLQTMCGLCRIQGDTDKWRSVWMVEALGLQRSEIDTLMQASTNYDKLAEALIARQNGKQGQDLGILR